MMQHPSRAAAARRAAGIAGIAALFVASPALAQDGGVIRAPGGVDAPPASPRTSPPPAPGGLSPTLTQEVYVAAFRSSARQWCAAGAADALAAASAGTRSIVQASVAEGERAGVESALDAAYDELARGGGCAALAAPRRLVVVDAFEGSTWGARRADVAPRDRARPDENGFVVVTRRAKLGGRRFHRVSAEAEYTFTVERGELVRGRYRIAAKSGEVAARWGEVERTLVERYPTLRVARLGASYAADAPATDFRAWSTTFVNPDTQALELRMSAAPTGGRDGEWVILVDFSGYAGR